MASDTSFDLSALEQEAINDIKYNDIYKNKDKSTVIQALISLSRSGFPEAHDILASIQQNKVVAAAAQKAEEKLQGALYNNNKITWGRLYGDIPYDLISGDACKVFMLMCNSCNASGIVEISISNITDILTIHKQTARRIITDLINNGFIVQTEQPKPGRAGHAARYMINPNIYFVGKDNHRQKQIQLFNSYKPANLPKTRLTYEKIVKPIKYCKLKFEPSTETSPNDDPKINQ